MKVWGRVGFDGGMEARGACRGTGGLVKPRTLQLPMNLATPWLPN